jgi:hypothetical protein
MARRRKIAWELRSDDCRARGGDCAAASQAALSLPPVPARPRAGAGGRRGRLRRPQIVRSALSSAAASRLNLSPVVRFVLVVQVPDPSHMGRVPGALRPNYRLLLRAAQCSPSRRPGALPADPAGRVRSPRMLIPPLDARSQSRPRKVTPLAVLVLAAVVATTRQASIAERTAVRLVPRRGQDNAGDDR